MERQTSRRSLVLTIALSVTALAPNAAVGALENGTAVAVRGGTATFDATTNVSAISIHGKSASLEGRATVRSTAGALVIDRLEATVPVKSLKTGLGLRDDHMRKHVFTTEDGQVPDLRFSATASSCAAADTKSTCKLDGELAVRGTPKPFTITLNVIREGGAFRVTGDGVVKLSAYGIPQPSQLGVRVEDDVKVHLDFVARPAAETVATREGR